MCTSVMAGREATVGGVVLISRNEDFTRDNWDKYLVQRPVPEYLVPATPAVAGGMWTLGNGLSVPAPATGYSYSAMPDAAGASEAPSGIGDHFLFEERGINQRNVAISATNSMTTNPAASAADPFPAVGVAESVIPTLILPQADSARHAVQLLGSYVERFGASEPNGVLLGDVTECWYFEIGSAHHWLAVRVPADCYVAVANGLRLHDVDLDGDGVLGSSGLFEFVVAHGLLDQPDRHCFDFARAFGILGVDYNNDRVWLAQRLLTPSLDQAPRLPQYPLFLRPDSPLDVAAVGGVRAELAHRGTADRADAGAGLPSGPDGSSRPGPARQHRDRVPGCLAGQAGHGRADDAGGDPRSAGT
ncbi:MAG: C69 family dipeptidase [Micropruina sp.]|nr:C69 family dipeptidase [Micropruina sp.]